MGSRGISRTAKGSSVQAEPEAGAMEKARTVGYLAGVALRAIERGNLAARIEMLEAIRKQRDKKI
jgi:hypothetical protein